ncbi:UNVERIFIED_CONTAM: hypothetical protein H355_003236 [Colinus virginianus]|nr:hypothetical protein H355_003236 [Colinus virginianus]
MAAGGERGRPGDLLLCAASGGGGTGGGGGDLKAAGCVGTLRGNDFRYNSRNAGTVNVGRAATVMNRPSRVEAGRQRFLILDSPSDENLPAYIEEMKAFNVMHLVRTCEATYDDALVRDAGICTHEWIFPDGEPPPEEVIDEWLTLCNSVASQPGAEAIAVHCVAGLGRAPVLVAVALIEKGMDPMDAIMFIRERRKGKLRTKKTDVQL